MTIQKNSAVTIQLQVSNQQGQLLQQGKHPVAYLHGGYGNLFPKIEEALEGQDVGYSLSLDLEPADAFGERDESLLQNMPKTQFPPGIKVGGQVQWHTQDGRPMEFNVVKIKGPVVMLDANHPMAGQALRCKIKVLEVRAATEEEVAHGHVHGAHGHQH
jgi:FKBP-type peptidyl-prolyl cis-trans isomerase SlyD